jgi:hypothetical protein
MHWTNDGKSAEKIQAPACCRIVNFTELDDATDKWLDIVQYGLSDGKKTKEFYYKVMTANATYSEDCCFFVLENERAVATLAVLCDYEKKRDIYIWSPAERTLAARATERFLIKLRNIVSKKRVCRPHFSPRTIGVSPLSKAIFARDLFPIFPPRISRRVGRRYTRS